MATVCHGPAAFLSAGSGPDGAWLFDGYKLVSVTDEEEDQISFGELGMSWYLESEPVAESNSDACMQQSRKL